MTESLSEPLNRPLARAVDAESGNTSLSSNASDLLDHASWGFLLTHHLHCFLGDFDEAKEVDFHLRSVLLLSELFEDSWETLSCVVDDDINALEFIDGGFERGIDVSFLGDVELHSEVVL